jgi:hypothetical protein
LRAARTRLLRRMRMMRNAVGALREAESTTA